MVALDVTTTGSQQHLNISAPGFKSFALKSLDTDGFGGPVTFEDITENNKLVGIRYVNSKVTEHDKGRYECKIENQFGAIYAHLNVEVELDFSSGEWR